MSKTRLNLPSSDTKLERGLSLTQATAINMIDMVGIGPFVTIPFIVGLMQGPMSIIAWLVGALLAYMDGMVWAEMGAKWPEAGGSYVFLQRLFGKRGRLMAFLFTWQTCIQAPLVIASGAIGFAQYISYFMPMTAVQSKMVSGGLVILLVILLYRNIRSIGRISVFFGVITGGTILWLILSGIPHFDVSRAFDFGEAPLSAGTLFYFALGQASLKAVYSYLGYYNVCHLGAEIRDPARNIPRSIFISITIIAVLYLSMQTTIMGVLPWQTIANSKYIASTFFEHVYGPWAGKLATVLILCVALASLFSVILGYSRIPYAAALNGDFFPVFGRLHPKYRFPYVSLLALGAVAFIFSLLYRLGEVITAIVVMRILIQFVSQAVGVIAWHYTGKANKFGPSATRSPDFDRGTAPVTQTSKVRPFNMPLFPLPAVISIIIWLFILFTSEPAFIAGAFGIIVSGIILFYIKEALYPHKRIS